MAQAQAQIQSQAQYEEDTDSVALGVDYAPLSPAELFARLNTAGMPLFRYKGALHTRP